MLAERVPSGYRVFHRVIPTSRRPLPQWYPIPFRGRSNTPPFVPPLRGRLVLRRLKSTDFFHDMVRLFGVVSFNGMDLFEVDETRFVLNACVNTLQTLALY